jgi:hypothetical protein
MDYAMVHDFVLENGILIPGRKRTIYEKVCCLEMRGLKGKLFNGITAVIFCIRRFSQRHSNLNHTGIAKLKNSNEKTSCMLQKGQQNILPASPSMYVILLSITAVFK